MSIMSELDTTNITLLAMNNNTLTTGDIVQVNASFLNEPADVFAYVYNTYQSHDGIGVNIITENNVNLGGFSHEESKIYLTFIKHSGIAYNFQNVIKLHMDLNYI